MFLTSQERQEITRRNLIVKQLAKDVTAVHRKARISNYDVYDERQRELVNACVHIGSRIERWVENGQGLFLFGGTGTGKDHCCVALMIHAVNNGIACRWIDCQAVLFPSIQRGESIEGELMTPKVVCLSDPVVDGTTDANRKALFRIVNRRWSKGLSTMVTCNVPQSMHGAEQLFGKRTLSRLLDRSTKLYCPWEDYRRRV